MIIGLSLSKTIMICFFFFFFNEKTFLIESKAKKYKEEGDQTKTSPKAGTNEANMAIEGAKD